jgi:signal transduction histidine kinase
MRVPLPPRPAWVRLPRRTARLRLTLLYGGLFLVSGTVLLAITYVLARTTGLFAHVSPPSTSDAGRRHVVSGQIFGSLSHLPAQANALHAADLHRLLVLSVTALAVMTVLSVALGWVVAGQVLGRLRTITTAARDISASNLHRRLALPGPDDEFKQLGDTLDELFGRLEASFEAQQASYEAQRRFVANASHELRTPLALERTLLQVALANPRAPAEALRSTCEELLQVGGQQQRLIDALLTLASSERGLAHREPFDLADAVADALLAAQPEIERSGVGIVTTIGPAPVMGDPDLATRLAANLIDNAARHNVPGGRIELTVRTRQGRAVLAVANTGPVIPSAEVGRLLQPFQRLSPAHGHHENGHGLGLSIVAAITHSHGATLNACARTEGGLDITISFPPVTAEADDTGMFN